MPEILETVLLLALPASGKSEVRRYLDSLSPDQCRAEFHIGPTVQLDDFPYVHFMRRIDDEMEALGYAREYFAAPHLSFRDGRDWGTLIHLINEDYADLKAKRRIEPESAAEYTFDRLDAASLKAGLPRRMRALNPKIKKIVRERLEEEAAAMLAEKIDNYPDTLEGKTVVIEFARGGPDGADMPLPAPHGYRYALSQLSPEILEKAAILYVWVTPEESRRKNFDRADPDDPGSILHHGVPKAVMMGEYGCDDMDWLEQNASRPGTIEVEAHGKTWVLPVGRFDNRVDKTTFLREPPETWSRENIRKVHEGLKAALDRMAGL